MPGRVASPAPAAGRSAHRAARRAALAPALAAVLAAASVVGCSAQDQLSRQARSGDATSYVAGDGSVTELAADQRGEPVALAGPATGEAGRVDVTRWRGDVVLVNVWYAACPPCRAEAPDLARIAAEYDGQGVHLVGVNTEDSRATAEAFERQFDIGYPSVLDADSGQALLALRGQVPPGAVPSTLVLDRTGRVSARVLGVADPTVLRSLLDAALAEAA